MDWKRAMEAERAALKRIVALLLALADLAERASGRSPAVRGFVLWLLLPAEALVRNLVTDAPAPIPLRRAGTSPADARRLAQCFRGLAAALIDLFGQTFSCANGPEILPRIRIAAPGTTPAEAPWTTLSLSRRAYDTP